MQNALKHVGWAELAAVLLTSLLSLGSGNVCSADRLDVSASDDGESYSEIVLGDEPIAYWRFGEAESERVRNAATHMTDSPQLDGDIVGVRFGDPGPRPERFPLFDPDNRAAHFHGGSGLVRVKDPGPGSVLDFDQGDAITLEAWVNPDSVGSGRHMYVVGKGRTNNDGFAKENQNYALRLTGVGGSAAVSFLFRNAANEPGNRNHWHRWTSESAITPGDGWHHVAVTYTFGRADSLRAYVNGRSVAGQWDLGGKTDAAPVVDDDELWIGSSLGGSSGSTFRGLLDEVAVYRTALTPEQISRRYEAVAPKPYVTDVEIPADGVLVEIQEGIPDRNSWDFIAPEPVDRYVEPAFAFVETPFKYSEKGLRIARSNPFLLRVTGLVELSAGKHRFLLRSRSAARLYMDDRLIVQTPFHKINGSAHGRITDRSQINEPNLRPLRTGDSENLAVVESPGTTHRFRLEVFVGGKNKRQETGETLVAHRPAGNGDPFRLLSPALDVPLTDSGWLEFIETRRTAMAQRNAENRRQAAVAWSEYWDRRHELARTIVEHKGGRGWTDQRKGSPGARPTGASLRSSPGHPRESAVHNDIDRFINARLAASGVKPAPLTDDWAFLRRVCVDVIGTIPTAQQIEEFMNDRSPDRRARLIDRLLHHPGWADNWVGYWQDVLAENPNIVKPTLNNTGPFRWWIHESFADNKPFDRFATELILMEGNKYLGAPAGFGMATQNDAPMAAKAHVIGQAFLGLEMKCARCHDAPFHDFKQKDLFSLAAMLNREPHPVPKTSSVPLSDEALASLIVEVTLKPGTKVAPEWPFDELAPENVPDGILRNPNDPRERLAALVTSPHNERFARVIVNRLWRRYMGRGLVEPVDDWQSAEISHPDLLDYLAREFVLSGYNLKHVARLILNSHTYQRWPLSEAGRPADEPYLFAGPLRRRMSAEQLLDSLFVAAGKQFNTGQLNMDLDGARPYSQFLNLGRPARAWEFASLSNERDRPSLSFPFAQDFISLLKAFGWRASRQNPTTERETDPTVLQPAILANGVVARRITRLSDDNALTELALDDQPVEQLVERVFLRLLTRRPTSQEREMFVNLLREGYANREIEVDPSEVKRHFPRPTGISWSNHFDPQANRIKIEMERLVERGDPPSVRLKTDWRERLEDMIWTLINTPEFVFVP